MSLRGFLTWWLRGLRATAVALDESVTQRRQQAQDDADLARDIAELRAIQARHQPPIVPVPLTVSLETLWARPVVEPDRSGYARPAFATINDLVVWLVYERSEGWWKTDAQAVRDAAVSWLAMRERVTGVTP